MYVIVLRYGDLVEVEKVQDTHRAFLNRHFGNGDFICAGPLAEREGVVIIARRKTRDEMERIMEKEPLVAAGAAGYAIHEFNPANYADGFQKYL